MLYFSIKLNGAGLTSNSSAKRGICQLLIQSAYLSHLMSRASGLRTDLPTADCHLQRQIWSVVTRRITPERYGASWTHFFELRMLNICTRSKMPYLGFRSRIRMHHLRPMASIHPKPIHSTRLDHISSGLTLLAYACRLLHPRHLYPLCGRSDDYHNARYKSSW